MLDLFPGLADVLCVVMGFSVVAFIWASWLVLSWGRDEHPKDGDDT